MKSAIVVGANGFVGNAVVRTLKNKGINVLAIVHNNNAERLKDMDDIEILSLDVSNIEELTNKVPYGQYDVMYYFAWEGSSGTLRSDYKLQLKNVGNLLNSMEISKKIGCKKIIVSGSIMEHECIECIYNSEDSPSENYIYGAGKVAAHLMASSLATKLGMDLVWAKITNTYGPGEKSPRLVNSTITKCINNTSPEFTSGIQNYDFVYIDDLANAFYLVGINGKPNRNYVIGSSCAKPLRDFLIDMQEAIAPDIDFKFGDLPYCGPNLQIKYFDCKALEEDTGFKAEVNFKEGCKRTKKWIKNMGGE